MSNDYPNIPKLLYTRINTEVRLKQGLYLI